MSAIQWLIAHFLPVYFYAAFAICCIGLAGKLLGYGALRLRGKREMTKRAHTPYPVKGKSLPEALWDANVRPYQIWWRANPIMFIGHLFYHAGLFLGMATYGLVALVSIRTLTQLEPYRAMQVVCDWFQFKKMLFAGNSVITLQAAEMMEIVFILALAFAVVGMLIPFVMSFVGKRGMTRSMDNVLRHAGISSTKGVKTVGSLRIQRKAVGLMVLGMDALMLSTFFLPKVSPEFACLVHVSFALTLIAALPFSFLFHELYRLRMWSSVRRIVDGRTA